ncbi:FCD domain-containing protein [Chelativorans oligotrophicus]|jgi:DNA-binding FadR family transcriptional regulator|uniref:Transcriptional regulator, GntR family n=2 Tax=Chelativorans TaxID=449972 RepID=Q11AN1_CHESB
MDTKYGMPARRTRLSHAVTEELQRQISTGALAPGAKLPTEQQMVIQFGVSRTVVREAVSALWANGLVEARQGSGVFVTGSKPHKSPGIFSEDMASLASALELFEVRMPLEIEAAGIAAMRRSVAQELAIQSALDHFKTSIINNQPPLEADLEFHMAIAEATNNHFYADALIFLARRTIARPHTSDKDYLAAVSAEHSRIASAISDQNPELAREEMRRHLAGSIKRYRVATLKNL